MDDTKPLQWPSWRDLKPTPGSLWHLRDDTGGVPRIWFKELGGVGRLVRPEEVLLVTQFDRAVFDRSQVTRSVDTILKDPDINRLLAREIT